MGLNDNYYYLENLFDFLMIVEDAIDRLHFHFDFLVDKSNHCQLLYIKIFHSNQFDLYNL
jgi:hypothetical protein